MHRLMNCLLICLLLSACAAPTQLTVKTPVPGAEAVPKDLQGVWIETHQPLNALPGESFSALRQRLIRSLSSGALPLASSRQDQPATELPYSRFFNGATPALQLTASELSWTDFRGPMPGEEAAGTPVKFAQDRLLAGSQGTETLYVSAGHDQLVEFPDEAAQALGLTIYLREAETRHRYGICFNPVEGNGISCDQLK